MRLPDAHRAAHAPFRPLVGKELRGLFRGRAFWLMLLLMCPLAGYSFFQAVSLYGEASLAAQQSPVLAVSLSPLDGVLVPVFGSLYVAVTLLFPFVAIRAVSQEKESGSLKLLVQLPYGPGRLLAGKALAVLAAWLLASTPVLSSLVVWMMLGGHLGAAETVTLMAGHAVYGGLVGAIALFCAAVTESAASAAIATLAFTIGSWALDFTIAGRPGLLDWVARLSLTQVIKPFEQGLLSAGAVLGPVVAAAGFVALAGVWLHPGRPLRRRIALSAGWVSAVVVGLALVAQVRIARDVSEDQRNSFPPADQRALAALREPLDILVHLAPEDPRYVDFQRNILAKLERAMPRVVARLAQDGGRPGAREERYGEVEYRYDGRSDVSRSTSHREILPLVYGLAGVPPPPPLPGADYPGYPLVANAAVALPWFFGVLPALIGVAWWLSRRPPRRHFASSYPGGAP